jgi:hypothetical protein
MGSLFGYQPTFEFDIQTKIPNKKLPLHFIMILLILYLNNAWYTCYLYLIKLTNNYIRT